MRVSPLMHKLIDNPPKNCRGDAQLRIFLFQGTERGGMHKFDLPFFLILFQKKI